MIFVTVGFQLGFDRLIKSMDNWCAATGYDQIFGQLGDIGEAGYRPTNFKWQSFIGPEEFKTRFETADLIVAHAGMGTIITAMTLKKPLVIFPRQAALNEHRNDHQIATAKQFATRNGIYLAEDDVQLVPLLNDLVKNPPAKLNEAASKFADPGLVSALREFIFDGSMQKNAS